MTQITLAKCKVDQLVKLCEEFGNQPGELINILHKAQGLIGYLPREVQGQLMNEDETLRILR